MDTPGQGAGRANGAFAPESQIDLPNYIRLSRRLSTPEHISNPVPVNGYRRQSVAHSAPTSSPRHLPQTNGILPADFALNNNYDKTADKTRDSLSDDPHDVEYSRAVDKLGLGKFHIFLALVCGFMFLSAALQNNLNAYILPSVSCDFHLSSSNMGLLNAVFLTGGITSNLMWGVVADMLGRKTVVVYGMLIDGLLSLICSLSQHFEMLVVFRFLSGFIVGGPAALVFNYMGEFFPDRIRTTVICYVGAFWTLSWVLMPALAWLIIPLQWSVDSDRFVFNSWRLLVALTALPSLTSAALLQLFPESPQFLLTQGSSIKALAVLSRIYSINNNKHPEDFPVKSLKEPLSIKDTGDKDLKSIWRPIIAVGRQLKMLFSASTFFTTILTASLFFSNMFGYYGLGLWLPELFNRMSNQLMLEPYAQVSICATRLTPVLNSTSAVPCDPTDVESSVFVKSVIMGAVGLLGNVMSGVLARKLQRRTLPAILMAVSALSVVIIYFTTNMTVNLILGSIFQFAVGTANPVYNALVVDMFPPSVSGVGVCIGIMAGRIGGMVSNLIIGNFLDINCSVPIFLVATVLLAGSFISMFIPNKPYSQNSSSTSVQKLNDQVFIAT